MEERTQGSRLVEVVRDPGVADQVAEGTVQVVKQRLPMTAEAVAYLPFSSFPVSLLGPRLLVPVVAVLRSHPEEEEGTAKEVPHQRLEWQVSQH